MKDFFKNIYARFVLGMGIRLYPTEPGLDDLIRDINKALRNKRPDLSITVSRYYIYIRDEAGNLEIALWNENKYHAWLSSGSYRVKHFDIYYAWNQAMPSTHLMLEFRKVMTDYITMDKAIFSTHLSQSTK